MAYLRKTDVFQAIKSRVQHINGKHYTIYEAYLGVNPLTRKPVRKAARSIEKLRKMISEFYQRLASGGDASTLLSSYQAIDAKNAIDLLVQARLDLTLTECVRRVIDNAEMQKTCNISVGKAFAKYTAQQEGKSEGHCAAVKSRVGGWVSRFGGERMLAEVKAKEVSDYLETSFLRAGAEKTKTTYNNHLNYIKTFLSWCAAPEQGYIKESPLASMKLKVKGYADPEYMKPNDVDRLFRVLEKRGGPDLADAILSFFCGMRQEEIQRVSEGEDSVVINLDEKYIRIIKVKGHLRGIKPRTFNIPEQAYRWMSAMPDFLAAATSPNPDFRRNLVEAAKDAGVRLPKNAGRHTFCTMFEAAHHDSNALSAIVGNSESIRDRHYNGVAKPQDGRDYFTILPSNAESAAIAESGSLSAKGTDGV